MVFATPGKLYLNPTTAADGGTLLTGIEDRLLSFEVFADVEEYRAGSGPAAGIRAFRARQERAILTLPLLGQSTAAIQLLWSHLTANGTALAPDRIGQFSLLPAFAMVLRPDLGSEQYLYAPKWRLAAGNEQAWVTSPYLPKFDGTVLRLIATDSGAATQPFFWGSAAAIDAHYDLGGE